jgi:osmotically-inducible protein OsmY
MTAFFVAAALLFVPAQAGVVTGVTDSAITTSIKTEIGVNPNVNTFGVHVSTNDGVVTLSGRVEDETQKALAEQIARDTKGVTDVVNNLTIIPTTITEKQERAFKQRATDKSVATAVRSRMVFNKESKGLKVGVDVVNGVVTLHGVVNTEEQKERLGKIASGTKGVESVVNNLVVRQRERHGFVGGVGTGMGDEWMEKKIESAILFTRKLSIRELDVEVDDGICYLSGVVENEEMKKVAGDIAAGYAGIREVKNSVIVREGGVTVEAPKKEGPVRPAPKANPPTASSAMTPRKATSPR